MKRISWLSNTGHSNYVNIGWGNILLSTNPALPSGGNVEFTLRQTVKNPAVGKVGGRVNCDGDWFPLICTSVSTVIEMSTTVGSYSVQVNINATSGTMSGDVQFDELVIFETMYDADGPEYEETTAASNPFTIDILRNDNIFSAIHYSTGYISAIGEVDDLDDYAVSQPTEQPVELYVDGVLEWRGFVKCETLSSEWYGGTIVNRIPVISPLGLLNGLYPPATIDGQGFKAFAQLILDINSIFVVPVYDKFIFPKFNYATLMYNFMMSLFYDYDDDEEKWQPKDYASILTAMCDLMGWQVQEHGSTLLFLANDCVGSRDGYVQLSVSDLITLASGTSVTPAELAWESQDIDYITTQHTISIHQGVSRIKVTGKSSPMKNPLVDVFDEKYMVARGYTSSEMTSITEDGQTMSITDYYNRDKEQSDQYANVRLFLDNFVMRTRNGLNCIFEIGETWNPSTGRYELVYQNQNNINAPLGSKPNEFAAGRMYPNIVSRQYGGNIGTVQIMDLNGGAYVINMREYYRGKKSNAYNYTYENVEGSGNFDKGIIFSRRLVSSSELIRGEVDVLVLHTGIFIEPLKNVQDNVFLFVNGHFQISKKTYGLFHDFDRDVYTNPTGGFYVGAKIGDTNIPFSYTTPTQDPNDIKGYPNDLFMDFNNDGGYIQFPDIDNNPNIRGELIFRIYGNPRVLGTDINDWPGWAMLTDFTVNVVDKRENKSAQTYVYNPVESVSIDNGFKNTISKTLQFTTQRSNYHRPCTGLIYSPAKQPLTYLYDDKYPEKALLDRMYDYYRVSRKEYDTTVNSGRMLDATKYISIGGKKYVVTHQSIDYAKDTNKIHLNETI